MALSELANRKQWEENQRRYEIKVFDGIGRLIHRSYRGIKPDIHALIRKLRKQRIRRGKPINMDIIVVITERKVVDTYVAHLARNGVIERA